jgi:hypothetical protein
MDQVEGEYKEIQSYIQLHLAGEKQRLLPFDYF